MDGGEEEWKGGLKEVWREEGRMERGRKNVKRKGEWKGEWNGGWSED